MPIIKIKEEHKQEVVAFGSNALPLGVRPDILDFAIMVRETDDPTFIKWFDELPTLDQLKKMKTDGQLKKLIRKEK